MGRPGVLLYFDILPALEQLPHEAVGELLLAALHYAKNGQEPTFGDSSLSFAWAFIKPTVDRDGAAYETKQLKGLWLAYCRECKRDDIEPLDFDTWRERVDNSTLHAVDVPLQSGDTALPTTTPIPSTITATNSKGAGKPPARKGFVPPTVQQVSEYCQERNNGINAEQFVDYYLARDWFAGKNKMKDWRAAVRCWERWQKTPNSRNQLKTSADYERGNDFFSGVR